MRPANGSDFDALVLECPCKGALGLNNGFPVRLGSKGPNEKVVWLRIVVE